MSHALSSEIREDQKLRYVTDPKFHLVVETVERRLFAAGVGRDIPDWRRWLALQIAGDLFPDDETERAAAELHRRLAEAMSARTPYTTPEHWGQ